MLKDKVVVVSGASKGLGRQLALQMAAQGCRLALIARNEEQLKMLAEDLAKDGAEAAAFPCDLSDSDSVYSTAEMIEKRFGKVDILINNAGLGHYKTFLEHTPQEHDQLIDVNFRAVVHLTQALLPGMIDGGQGHIVNIGSDLSQTPLANMAVYAATKFALRGFSLSLLREVKNKGVKVSLINPGIIDTNFNNAEEGSKEATWSLQPNELAQLVVQVISQPGYQLVDELTVHPQMQDF